MKLEVGMYVRTENGVIEKVNRIYDRHTTDNIFVWLNACGDGQSVFIDDFEEIEFLFGNSRGFIKKEPSFDIIDLIEVGDYVNGYKVRGTSVSTLLLDNFNMIQIDEEDIKSIVTKEQFESVQYKVVE